ncbi:MAG: rhomboid family intramembrane serine protease [Wenzhouxiangella sp.]
MQLHVPDPKFTGSGRAGRNFVLAIKIMLGFLAVVWAVFLFERLLAINLSQYGLRPREGIGLLGLLTTPLLHGNLSHIGSNSAPLFIGGVAMLFLYPNSSLRALPMIYVGSAALAWVFARPSLHIGASGLVYGILTFVFVSGLLRRDMRSVGVSLMIWFLYGSMLWGVLPGAHLMSWELHASGMMIGLVLAVVYRAWDRPPVKRYEWDDEDHADSSGQGDNWRDDYDWRETRHDNRSDDGNERPDPWRDDRWH